MSTHHKDFDFETCKKESNETGSLTANTLASLGQAATRPNYVWSVVHFLVHNAQNPMPSQSITASRNIAIHLSQRFWCTNCRAYFTEGILEVYGLPPHSNNPEDHAKYWNYGHNVASEHVASTRGDDPWYYQLGDSSVSDYQNPFYISFEEAQKQWKYNPEKKGSIDHPGGGRPVDHPGVGRPLPFKEDHPNASSSLDAPEKKKKGFKVARD